MLSLAAMCLVGCGTTSTSKENWAYLGSDATLRSPPRIPRANLSSEAWLSKLRENEEAWRQKRQEAVEAAKDACARETGASGKRSFWTGYGAAFMACMNARGWSGLSNPL